MPLAVADGLHPRQCKPIVAHRQIGGGVEPVFENATFPNEAIEVLGFIVRNAIPQCVIVRTGDDGDGVDLHVAELFERAMCGLDATTERLHARKALCIERDAPQQVAGRRGHPSESLWLPPLRSSHV